MRLETLTESVPLDLELDLQTARALASAGRNLAAKQRGAVGDEAEAAEPNAIRCAMNPNGTWRLTVADAVGVIQVGDLQISVEPKIPRDHLFFLFGKSKLFPRVNESRAAAEAGEHLWHLLAT